MFNQLYTITGARARKVRNGMEKNQHKNLNMLINQEIKCCISYEIYRFLLRKI